MPSSKPIPSQHLSHKGGITISAKPRYMANTIASAAKCRTQAVPARSVIHNITKNKPANISLIPSALQSHKNHTQHKKHKSRIKLSFMRIFPSFKSRCSIPSRWHWPTASTKFLKKHFTNDSLWAPFFIIHSSSVHPSSINSNTNKYSLSVSYASNNLFTPLQLDNLFKIKYSRG